MATLKTKNVYEYCEKLYEKFKKEDGGYYPRIHDVSVFKKAATEFGKTIEETLKDYDSYSKLFAKIEVERINRLPEAKRQAVMRQRIYKIMQNNRDLDFLKIESEPQVEYDMPDDIFDEEYKGMITNMARLGWTIPLNIELKRLNELEECTSDAVKLDSFFKNFYTKSEFDDMCSFISRIIVKAGQNKRFEECKDIYLRGQYSSCITVLTTVLEGFISTFGTDPKDVRVMSICSYHAKKESEKGNKITSLCWQSMHEYTKILFEKSDFSQDEPNNANRHWIIHGRTSKLGEIVDCLRLFNALSTMASIKGTNPQNN